MVVWAYMVQTIFYLSVWIILLKSFGIVKAVLLSVISSLAFIFSGVIIASIPLFSFSIIFAVSHILISVKNSDSGYFTQKSVNDVAPDEV